MKRFFAVLFLLFCVAGLSLFLFFRLASPQIEGNETSKTIKPNKAPLQVPSQKAVSSAPLPAAQGVDPELINFFRTEAASIDSPNTNAEAAEQRAVSAAAKMKAPEITYAKELVVQASAPIKERILATFLLTLAQPKSLEALREIIGAPTQIKETPEAHSVAEVQSAQEKALKIMAIDALAERAVTSSDAKDALLRLEAEVKDPTLSKYLQNKIRQIK